jgi:NADPH-dependent 2,4-dienoyl-CoA reductase/sulfur reductase-like enzyme
VVNVIPPQRAGQIAVAAGLVGDDKNWCPVNPTTFESTKQAGIHVIGDACIAGAMPKSGYSANSEAKVCAMNIVALMNGKELTEMSGINTCYSYITDKEAVSVAAVYKVAEGKIIAVPNSGGVSPADFSAAKLEADLCRELAEEHPDRNVDLSRLMLLQKQTPPWRGLFFRSRNRASCARYCRNHRHRARWPEIRQRH